MSKGRGYLLPEIPVAEDCGCVLVFYPDRPEYLHALMGALQYFETWVAWEREEQHNGKVAAEEWQQANEITRDFMICANGLPDALNNIADAIALGSGGNCCTVTVTDVIGLPPEWGDEGDTQVPGTSPIENPAGWPVEQVYDDYKCRASGAIVADLVQTLSGMSSLGGMLAAIGAVAFYSLLNTTMLGGLIVGLMAIGLSASGAVILLIGAFITMVATGSAAFGVLLTVANNIDSEALVCALYNSLSTTEAETAVSVAIADAFALIGGSDEKSAAESAIVTISQVLLTQQMFSVLFNYDEETALRAPLHSCASCIEEIDLGWTPLVVADDGTFNYLDGWEVGNETATAYNFAFSPGDIQPSNGDICSAFNWCKGVSGTYLYAIQTHWGYLNHAESRLRSGKDGFGVAVNSKAYAWVARWVSTQGLTLEVYDGANIVSTQTLDMSGYTIGASPTFVEFDYIFLPGVSYNFKVTGTHACGGFSILPI